MAQRRSCSDRNVTVLMWLLYSSKKTVWNLPLSRIDERIMVIFVKPK